MICFFHLPLYPNTKKVMYLKKVTIFMICVVGIVVMLVGSKIAANYFSVHANIDPFSKSASLLTLLFMCFCFLGVFLTAAIVLIWEHFYKVKS